MDVLWQSKPFRSDPIPRDVAVPRSDPMTIRANDPTNADTNAHASGTVHFARLGRYSINAVRPVDAAKPLALAYDLPRELAASRAYDMTDATFYKHVGECVSSHAIVRCMLDESVSITC